MIFTSWSYALFLPLVVILYHLLQNRHYRKLILLAASFFFYGYLQPRLCILLVSCSVVGYLGALLLERYKTGRVFICAATLFLLLLNLAFFKYSFFIAANLREISAYSQYFIDLASGLENMIAQAYQSLGLENPQSRLLPPLGISFYTFQCIGYVVDVYRRELKADKNPLEIILFVSFFPQLVAGPIERAGHLLPQLVNGKPFCFEKISSSVGLLLIGLVKKMVVADNLALIADNIYAQESPSPLLLYLGTLAFAFQIYCDFTGYTDIARASARMLGIDLLENFHSPYLSRTPVEFWQRWHISFSRWICDYLYIPLGGSRRGGMAGFFIIIMLTMALSGLWHGAAWHFILWGVFHGLLVFVAHILRLHKKKEYSRLSGIGFCAVNFNLILAGWVLFRARSVSWIETVVKNGFSGGAGLDPAACLSLGVKIVFYLLPLLLIALYAKSDNQWAKGAVAGVLLVVLFVLARTTDYDFIYFRF